MARTSTESGFSLVELMVATCVFLVITSIVATALRQITNSQTTIWNRTQMHSGVRGATELMQQEVGQAGRVATGPVPIEIHASNPMITGQIAMGSLCDPGNPGAMATTVKVTSVEGLYATAGAVPASFTLITTMDGPNRETTPIWSIDTSVTPPTVTACFNNDHQPGATLMALGGFANGIVPPNGVPNGSTGNVLKMFGDINGDGHMVYVEYTCDPVNTHKLYRNVMDFNATVKPPLSDALVLLNNVMPHPDGSTICFTYQTDGAAPAIVVQGNPVVFVLDVAITLTVQTQQLDPVTKAYQTETKALLNVSPRNVFNTWQLANAGFTDHIQSTPATITALLGM
jgi:type II secretory pathway pseudopilin PulG